MAPISAIAPAGTQSTSLSNTAKSLKRGMSLKRASTQRRSRQQQQLPSQFLQPMQGQQDGEEDEDTITSRQPSAQTYRHRDRQSHYIDPRQHILHLPDSQRPASSRSHMRDWNRQRERSRSPSSSKKLPLPDNLLHQPHIESYSSLPSSASLTSEEFEALPPTVQRKYFSTLERLRFAQTCCAGHSDQPCGYSTSTFASDEDICQPGFWSALASDPFIPGPYQQPRVRSSSARLYPNQVDTLRGRPADNPERQSHTSNSHHKSIILDATDEAFVKINKRHSQFPRLGSHFNEPFSHDFHPIMSSSASNEFTKALAAESTPDSIIESFRWLDEDDDLDLRLDDYQSSPKQGKKKRMAFPRHLSISKLSFGRPSSQISRPATKGTVASPALSEQFVAPSLPSPAGHFRRRSRALSLMSPNKGQMPDDSNIIDSAPSHYQDPEARMKLRVYLASPHKFDEAVEFGFPSLHDMQGMETSHDRTWSRQESYDKTHRSTGDDAESFISDPPSPVETVSPRTPESLDQLSVEHSPRSPHEAAWPSKVDYAQAPASSREMTLRMTLTRPDLRADEEQMYGWQKPPSSKGHAHDGSAQPRSYTRPVNPKDDIEKQFAIMDQEAANGDGNVVKRFWNKVRRT